MKKKKWSKAQERREAAQQFFCTWGRHRVHGDYILNETFDHGTMCLLCQHMIVENLREVLFMPEMTAALREQERRKFELARRERFLAKVLQQKLPDENVTGMVYYLRINGHIKIGYTSDLRQRSRSYPPGSELLAIEPATKATERERHQDFARYLERGREWFRESEVLVEHMAALKETYGLPTWLMHKYTEHDTPGT